MTTEQLKTFKVELFISAECEDDAVELLEDYTGEETSIEILKVFETKSFCNNCGEGILVKYPAENMLPAVTKCNICGNEEEIKEVKQ